MRGNNSWLLPKVWQTTLIPPLFFLDKNLVFQASEKANARQEYFVTVRCSGKEMDFFATACTAFYKVLRWREMRVLTCCEIPKLSLSQAPSERAAFRTDPTTKQPLVFSMMTLPILDVIPRAKSWLCAPAFKCCYLTVKGRENHRIIEAASHCWRSYDPYGDNMSVHPFFLKKHNLSHQVARPPYKLLKLLVNVIQVCQCRAQKGT